jgi:hypothetical protein
MAGSRAAFVDEDIADPRAVDLRLVECRVGMRGVR